MWGFVFGVLLGIAGKAIYDLFKEEPFPPDVGLNAGRLEALLDETRQTVRELREEVRQAVSGEGTVQEKAGRVVSAASEAVKSRTSGEGGVGQETAAGEERLTVTGGGDQGASVAESTGGAESSSGGALSTGEGGSKS